MRARYTPETASAGICHDAEIAQFCSSKYGVKYGLQGQGSGRMPGFGSLLTDEQIQAIVNYVRNEL